MLYEKRTRACVRALPFDSHVLNVWASSVKIRQIFSRGPIAAGIDATPELEKYTGGIFSQEQVIPMINHEVGGASGPGRRIILGGASLGIFSNEFPSLFLGQCRSPSSAGASTP
jgi:hypothetical protein